MNKVRIAKEFGKVIYKLIAIGEDNFFRLSKETRIAFTDIVEDLNYKLIMNDISTKELADYLDVDAEELDCMIDTIIYLGDR